MLNAPKPDKAAALQWKAPLKLNLALMAESLKSLMGLIGKAWSDRAGMLEWLIEGIFMAFPGNAELGIDGDTLEGLHLAISHGTADVSAPLVQAVLHLEGEYSATFVLSLKHACSELTEDHPLRLALVDLDSRARISGTTDG